MHAVQAHILLCIISLKTFSARSIIEDYEKNRRDILAEEFSFTLGGKLQLTEQERLANDILMKLKETEVDNYFQNPELFNFSRHYFSYRDKIESSEVYKIIRRMPKGAALHIHSTLALGADYMLKITYEHEDHLYACYTEDDLQLQFSDATPQRPCNAQWTLLSELRKASDDLNGFDSELKQFFTLFSEDANNQNSEINSVWKRFDKIYRAMKSLILFRPVREKFTYDLLEKFYDDNIMYIEARSGLHELYELNGTVHDKIYMAQLYQDVTKKFKESHPDFIGMKLILTRNRAADVTQVREALSWARILKKELPDTFAGFDLVGQEDRGKTLEYFLPALIEAKDEINYYFHAGETNWLGTTTDENLLDAILLGSKRIGHAYALLKHPALLTVVKKQDIALEVNVISNAVLSLVRDLRNHPLATYLSLDLPVVLSSDDPGAWGADPLSHDFYVAFVAVASKHADLRMLKQLALNSIKYSALNNITKANFLLSFNKSWESFLKNVIELHS